MLREGWDVQNATVIAGLRPYTSKANILPEQTIGRGLQSFSAALKSLVIEELTPSLEGHARKLSDTPAFPFSRPTFSASKTIFNLVAADNEFEREFGRFLQKASDVVSFAKLPKQFGFTIEYSDSVGNLRLYEPDFVAIDGEFYGDIRSGSRRFN